MTVVAQIVFNGRLLAPDGAPAKGADVEVSLFLLEVNEWEPLATATAGSDGLFEGSIALEDVSGQFAPMISLMFDSSILETAVQPSTKSAGRVLSVNFGDVVIDKAARPTKVVLEQKPLDSVISSLGGKMDAANTALRQNSSGRLRVGDVKVTLRGVVGDDGLGIALNSPEATASAGSMVEVQYKQDEDEQETDSGPLTRVVPDVRGTTETLARRILSSVGLQMSYSTKSAGAGESVGQCVVQSPGPGAEIELGATVLAVFAE
jgi:hypothetical protein